MYPSEEEVKNMYREFLKMVLTKNINSARIKTLKRRNQYDT